MDKEAQRNAVRLHHLVPLMGDLYRLVLGGQPLDVQWQLITRQHKQWGSRDRRFYGNTVFSFFRWLGWIRPALDLNDPAQWTEKEWSKALELAAALEGYLLPESHFAGLAAEGRKLSELAEAFEKTFGQSFKADQLFDPATHDLLALAGEEAWHAFAERQQSRPPMWLVARFPLKFEEVITELDQAGVNWERHPHLPLALAVKDPVNLQQFNFGKKDWVQVQDVASQWIVKFCEAGRGEMWLDYCAGAGGKTLGLGAAVGPRGRVVGCDIREKALSEMSKRARKAGLKAVIPGKYSHLPRAGFDGVLVDGPCSNSGTWRRNPALRWQFDEARVLEKAKLQRQLLEEAAVYVKPGGKLVYATCSLTTAENFDQIRAFLADFTDFELTAMPNPVTGDRGQQHGLILDERFGDGDSMFVAVMTRKKDA